jgi:hypothetical protein
MRDELKGKASQNESLVLNLDDFVGPGTHWVCLFIKNGEKIYFDSFGLKPPLELQEYCGTPIRYQSHQLQNYNQIICGHYCIYVLFRLSNGDSFKDIYLDLL